MLSTIVFSSTRTVASATAWLATVLRALLLVTLLIGGVVAVAVAVMAIPTTLWVGLALTALFAVATFPRKAVRNG